MPAKQLHVVMVNLRWAVIRAGFPVPISTHDRKEDAIHVARALAARESAELIVYDIGGRPQPVENDAAPHGPGGR